MIITLPGSAKNKLRSYRLLKSRTGYRYWQYTVEDCPKKLTRQGIGCHKSLIENGRYCNQDKIEDELSFIEFSLYNRLLYFVD